MNIEIFRQMLEVIKGDGDSLSWEYILEYYKKTSIENNPFIEFFGKFVEKLQSDERIKSINQKIENEKNGERIDLKTVFDDIKNSIPNKSPIIRLFVEHNPTPRNNTRSYVDYIRILGYNTKDKSFFTFNISSVWLVIWANRRLKPGVNEKELCFTVSTGKRDPDIQIEDKIFSVIEENDKIILINHQNADTKQDISEESVNEALEKAKEIFLDKMFKNFEKEKPGKNHQGNNDMNKEKITDKLKELLEYQKNIILEGPPGTSKTFTAFEIVKRELGIEEKDLPKYQFSIVNDKDSLQNGAWDIVQFHPSYSYEDFVQGIVAEPTNGSITFKVKDKLFSELCKFADKNKEKKFFLIIDEINRGDLSKIFGELIYGLEYRSEENKPNYIRTTYSELSIPDNLYIIGTMNTADRRIAMVDYALRRRFAFVTLSPNEETLKAFYGDGDDPKNKGLKEKAIDLFNQTQKIFKDEYKDYKLGHTYFMAKNLDHLRCKVEYQVKPILEEYKKEGIIDKIPDLKVEQK